MNEESDILEQYMYKEEIDSTTPLSTYINPNLPQCDVEQFVGNNKGDNNEEGAE